MVAGGLWRRPEANGEYRLVVVRQDWAENTSHIFYLQWVRTDHAHAREVVEHTTRIAELNGCRLSEESHFLSTDDPDSFGQSFQLTAYPLGTDDDRVFTITPQPDYQYSINSTKPPLLGTKSTAMAWAGGVGALFGSFFTWMRFRRRKAPAHFAVLASDWSVSFSRTS